MMKTLLALLALATAAQAQELFPLQEITPANITVKQNVMAVLQPQVPNLTYTYTLTFLQNTTVGCAGFGAALFEPNASPSGSTAGSIDTVVVGSEAATIDHITTENVGIGPSMVTFHVLNMTSAEPSVTVSSSTQGHFIQESIAFTEICGLPADASIDVQNGLWGRMPAGGAWSSPTVTPTQSGDFLYGVAFDYDFSEPALGPGTGWTLINNCGTVPAQCTGNDIMSPSQEYQIYNSTAPVAATFPTPAANTNTEAWAGIIAVKLP